MDLSKTFDRLIRVVGNQKSRCPLLGHCATKRLICFSARSKVEQLMCPKRSKSAFVVVANKVKSENWKAGK